MRNLRAFSWWKNFRVVCCWLYPSVCCWLYPSRRLQDWTYAHVVQAITITKCSSNWMSIIKISPSIALFQILEVRWNLKQKFRTARIKLHSASWNLHQVHFHLELQAHKQQSNSFLSDHSPHFRVKHYSDHWTLCCSPEIHVWDRLTECSRIHNMHSNHHLLRPQIPITEETIFFAWSNANLRNIFKNCTARHFRIFNWTDQTVESIQTRNVNLNTRFDQPVTQRMHLL